MSSGLSLTLLGGLHITLDGRPLDKALTSKAAALLVYLAVTGRPQGRTALAGLLWGESSEHKARASLRTALAALNRYVPTYLRVARQELAFDPSQPHRVDALVFRDEVAPALAAYEASAAALSAAEAARLHELVSLYQGEFLAGSEIDDAPLFEEWLIGERERLQQLALRALYHLAVHYTDTGAYAAGIAAAERLLALAPWQEEAHRQLMRLLALDGRRSAALAQYEACGQLLAAELGIAPTAETTALCEQIRRGEISPPTAPPRRPDHNLPVQMTPFFGREEELARLQARLEDPAHRLVTIIGLGGVGKTRLARVGAERVLDRFADGVWWVPLADVQPGSAVDQSLAAAVARALGLTLYGEAEPTAQLLAYLRARHLLLVLDNMEHLLEGANLLVELLQGAPHLKLLVTSRERLNLQVEAALGLKGLPVPAGPHVPAASAFSSVRLFAERAERTPAGFVLGMENLPHVIRICALVDGLPLGIELAAAWVEWLDCAGIAATIVQDLGLMETSLRDVPQRHRSMRAVFEGSWRLLGDAEKGQLARCAVFHDGFAEDAADVVAGATPAVLHSLAAKSLLRRPAAGRYGMHSLLRQFALEKLDLAPADRSGAGGAEGRGEAAEVYAGHSAYYLDWLARQEGALRGRGARLAVAAVQRDWGNVRQAWLWAAERGAAAAIPRGGRVLAAFCQFSGLLREGAELMARAAAHLQARLAGRAEPEVRLALAAVLVEQADLLNAQGWSEPALAVARQAMQLVQHGRAVELEASALLQRGVALARQMDYAGARHAGRLAQTLAWQAGALPVEAGSQLLLGQIEHVAGDYGVARVCYEEALRVYRQIGDPRGEGAALVQMGVLADAQGDLAAAHRHYERARALFQQLADRHQEGMVLAHMGRMAVREGDYATAWAHDEQALAILGEMGDRRAEGSTLSDMGALLVVLGQYARARETYERALRLWREIGYRAGEAGTLNGLAGVAEGQGDFAAAESLARQSSAIAGESGERSAQARAANCLGQALAGQSRWEEAAAAFWTALAQSRELGEHAMAAQALAGQARVALARGDLPQAQAHVAGILSLLERFGSFPGAGDDLGLYLICGQVLQAVGDGRAGQLLAEAHRLLEARAARIANPEFRRSLRQEVAANREIARLEAELGHSCD